MAMARTVDMKTNQLIGAGSTLEKLLIERDQVRAACEALERILDKDAAWRKKEPERRPRAKPA